MNDFKMKELISKVEIVPRNTYVRNLVIVDGIMRTGKFLHDALISGLERCEMWQQYPMIDSIPMLHGLGLLTTDVAVALLQRELDMHLYYSMLGRRSNFRYSDRSSIWHSRDPRAYFRRIFMKEEVEVLDKLVKQEIDPIFVLSTHDMMCNIDILFRAYPNLRMIWCRRHPIDIAYSWHMKDWGNRIGVEPRSLALAFKGPSGPVPWFALDWAESYESFRPMDRIIYSIDWEVRRASSVYNDLPKRKKERILIATFEDVVTHTDSYLDQMCSFIKTCKSYATARILEEERVPRVLSRVDFENRLKTIKEHATAKAFAYLLEMGKTYEKESRKVFGIDINSLRKD